MKLLNVTNRYYIAIALALLLISSAFLSYRVFDLLDNEISEHMLFEKMEIEKQLSAQRDIQGINFVIGDKIEIEPLEKFTTFRVSLVDTIKFDPYEDAVVPYRRLSYEQLIGEDSYRITLWKRLSETEGLFSGVAFTLLLVAIDIIACFYFLNRWFSKRVWKPFYRALSGLKHFDLHKGERISFQRSEIEEFNTLNVELSKLTDKVARDYQNLREFTENMSHETQTPLAIIRSKLELLVQSEKLDSEQLGHIKSALDSVNRLSKMNKSLILLTRIENDQYNIAEALNFSQLIRRHLDKFDLFISSRELQLKLNLEENVWIKINPNLADILLSNLLSNAIKYNTIHGELKIDLTSSQLKISNSGAPLTIEGDQIFERFKKGDQPDSVGLGLAIVKKVCDHCSCDIHYTYRDDRHVFTIEFPVEKVIDEEEA
ncbi:MAG: HAMP domain-containing histidine kinase [Bacteroidetes bacterium]|nr:MAG: HAMP domain-containing histidine kinase [Bacteroidota bacterium]